MFISALLVALSCAYASSLAALSAVEDDNECALYLSGPGRTSSFDYTLNLLRGNFGYEGHHTCITYDAVNQAYLEARKRIVVAQPKGDWKPDDYASVGELILDISINLARTYGLTYEEIEKGLPLIDTSRTLIREVCPPVFSHVECRAGKYRRFDGLCNNLKHPTWGSTNVPFQRLIGPLFADGINAPRISHTGRPLPLSRVVSRTMHQDEGYHDHAGTVMVIAWGQFMDHDYTLTGTPLDPMNRNDPEECCKRPRHLKHPYCNEIPIPADDYFYRLFGVDCIDFVRAFPSPRPGCRLGSRVPFNTLTGVLDGNTVYGITEKFARKLRTGYGGLLRMNDVFKEYGLKDLLPLKLDIPDEGCTRPNKNMYCFEAGEIRVNEQLVLTVMHTLMAREHNRIAKALAAVNPHWDDETLFQEARRINIAEIQHITYNEFLPILLGKDVMEKFGLVPVKEGFWDGHDPNVNPDVIDAFASAAFRFGHSLLPTAVERWSKAHKFIASKRLSDLIRRPYDLYRAGVLDEYVMGLMNQVAQAMDDSITQEVTNHLFKKVGARFGMDLVSFNMQRGREFGIPGYMEYRKFCGLEGANSFQDLYGAMPNETVRKFESIFEHPIDVDLWSGGVSERPLPDSMLGPTFACIIATQFSYARRGDRFWYELPNQPSSFTPEQLVEVRKARLARVICDNTDIIDTVQLYPMVLPDHELNPRVPCKSGIIPSMDFTKWAEPVPHIKSSKHFMTDAIFLDKNTTNELSLKNETGNDELYHNNLTELLNGLVGENVTSIKEITQTPERHSALINSIANSTKENVHDDKMSSGNATNLDPTQSNETENIVDSEKQNSIQNENSTLGDDENIKNKTKRSLIHSRKPLLKSPLIINYNVEHDREPLAPEHRSGDSIRLSDLADFNIETLHEPSIQPPLEPLNNEERPVSYRNGNIMQNKEHASYDKGESNYNIRPKEHLDKKGDQNWHSYGNLDIVHLEFTTIDPLEKSELISPVEESQTKDLSIELNNNSNEPQSDSYEDIRKLNLKKLTEERNENIGANNLTTPLPQLRTEDNIKPDIQEVDLQDFTYERIFVNEKGEVEAANDNNENDRPDPTESSDKHQAQLNYEDDSSSLESNKKINDEEVKPVIEVGDESVSVESDADNVKNKENSSQNEDTPSTEEKSRLTVTDKEENVKQQFERIPKNFNYDKDEKQKQPKNPDTKNESDSNNENVPEKPFFDENLVFKFHDLHLDLPEIILPHDVIHHSYEDDNDKKEKQSHSNFHDEDSASDESEDDSKSSYENERGYYRDNYDEDKKKQKQKHEDDEDETGDLYEKFVQKHFGKRRTFEKRSEPYRYNVEPKSPHLSEALKKVLKKTEKVDQQAAKSGDPNANYMWTLEYGEKL